ncbi:hypothetical protein AB0J40_07850 [Amycolatopsis sp. NPDC049691]|uniref:hypothetical protein n=1 Tax=Amycolatopsis sp. NPDC049691 TaxID=3155155 RepID=UPI00341F9E37
MIRQSPPESLVTPWVSLGKPGKCRAKYRCTQDRDHLVGEHEFFLDDGVHVASVLSSGSMMNCSAQPRPSRVLSLTHGSTSHAGGSARQTESTPASLCPVYWPIR